MKIQKIFIITGVSGSGKSTAMDAFEDAGFYCVDNMPMALLPKFLDLPLKNDPGIHGFAFVMDMRAKDFLSHYSLMVDEVSEKGIRPVTIFLDTDKKTLLKRYSETRRLHPVSNDSTLVESINSEKKIMRPIKEKADIIIDTTMYNSHRLKAEIVSIAEKHSKTTISMKINIMSFGFKYGPPHDADLIIDMRFLSNPYFIPALKKQDGESKAVKNFVLALDETKIFLSKYLPLLEFLIPLYKKEGKAYLTIATGCTGGRHRSVAIARKIFEHLNSLGIKTNITHRDIDRDIKIG